MGIELQIILIKRNVLKVNSIVNRSSKIGEDHTNLIKQHVLQLNRVVKAQKPTMIKSKRSEDHFGRTKVLSRQSNPKRTHIGHL